MKIVVIGAGIAGLAIGWRLALAGQKVMVLERAQPGRGATWASAGMLAVTAELLNAGKEEIEFSRHSNNLWPSFAKEIEEKSGRSIEYDRGGALLLAEDALALDRLARQVDLRSDLELVDATRLREIAPLVSGDVAGGLWSAREARVNNRALGVAMAIALQRAGGIIKTNEAVVRIERRENRAAIAHTPYGLYHADAFVLAAGAWSGLLQKEIAPIFPVKGQMILLSPPPGVEPSRCVIWGNGIYAVPRKDGLCVGATAEEVGFDTALTPEARDTLLGAAKKLMPSLKDWTLADQWAGLRPKGPDGLPLLGPTSVEGLWLASGQYRNGILFAPAIAETMCQQILGGRGIAAFDPRRFSS
ncbi:MAG TPA: glycine oxidase ThiO [Rhizomicrobium sp.]|nr:glycine oxidase ThiO [Rhizomicrobium sp.]